MSQRLVALRAAVGLPTAPAGTPNRAYACLAIAGDIEVSERFSAELGARNARTPTQLDLELLAAGPAGAVYK